MSPAAVVLFAVVPLALLAAVLVYLSMGRGDRSDDAASGRGESDAVPWVERSGPQRPSDVDRFDPAGGPDTTAPETTEPAPTEPEPTEPAPTEPEPTEPAPTEPAGTGGGSVVETEFGEISDLDRYCRAWRVLEADAPRSDAATTGEVLDEMGAIATLLAPNLRDMESVTSGELRDDAATGARMMEDLILLYGIPLDDPRSGSPEQFAAVQRIRDLRGKVVDDPFRRLGAAADRHC